MVINRKQLINLILASVTMVIVLIMLLGVGLKTTVFNIDGKIAALVLKGFDSSQTINGDKNIVTVGLKFFTGENIPNSFLKILNVIYGAQVTIFFFASLLLVVSISDFYMGNNIKLKLISDIINKICWLLIIILFIVVLVKFNSFVKELTAIFPPEINAAAKVSVSALTWGLFIPFAILLPLGLLGFATIANLDIYKGLNVKVDSKK